MHNNNKNERNTISDGQSGDITLRWKHEEKMRTTKRTQWVKTGQYHYILWGTFVWFCCKGCIKVHSPSAQWFCAVPKHNCSSSQLFPLVHTHTALNAMVPGRGYYLYIRHQLSEKWLQLHWIGGLSLFVQTRHKQIRWFLDYATQWLIFAETAAFGYTDR